MKAKAKTTKRAKKATVNKEGQKTKGQRPGKTGITRLAAAGSHKTKKPLQETTSTPELATQHAITLKTKHLQESMLFAPLASQQLGYFPLEDQTPEQLGEIRKQLIRSPNRLIEAWPNYYLMWAHCESVAILAKSEISRDSVMEYVRDDFDPLVLAAHGFLEVMVDRYCERRSAVISIHRFADGRRPLNALGWDLVVEMPLEAAIEEARAILDWSSHDCAPQRDAGSISCEYTPQLYQVRAHVRYARVNWPAQIYFQISWPDRIRIDRRCRLWRCEHGAW